MRVRKGYVNTFPAIEQCDHVQLLGENCNITFGTERIVAGVACVTCMQQSN